MKNLAGSLSISRLGILKATVSYGSAANSKYLSTLVSEWLVRINEDGLIVLVDRFDLLLEGAHKAVPRDEVLFDFGVGNLTSPAPRSEHQRAEGRGTRLRNPTHHQTMEATDLKQQASLPRSRVALARYLVPRSPDLKRLARCGLLLEPVEE